MEHLSKFLLCIKNDAKIFQKIDYCFVFGLTTTQLKNLKQYSIQNELIQEQKREYYLTSKAEKLLKQQMLDFWINAEYPKRPKINLEYLKDEKPTAQLTRAIRLLEIHFFYNEFLKPNSTEEYLKRELLSDTSSCKDILIELEADIINQEKVALIDLEEKYFAKPYGLTRSIYRVLLLGILVKNKDTLAIYENGQFQIEFDNLTFERMIYAPQKFVIKRTVFDNPALKKISKIISGKEKTNILEITKDLIQLIKRLDKYVLVTKNLSKNSLRFRNVILNAKDPIKLFSSDIPKSFGYKSLEECDGKFFILFKKSIQELNTRFNLLNKELHEFLLKSFHAKNRKDLAERFNFISEYISEKDLRILFNNICESAENDSLWINRIATFVNKTRVPKDWYDDDIADYKLKIKELALRFHTIEATVIEKGIMVDDEIRKILKEINKLSKSQKLTILRKVANE